MSNDESFPAKPPRDYSPRVTDAYDGLLTKQEPTKRICVDLPQSLHTRVKIGCVKESVSITQILRDYLEKKFPDID